MIGHADIFGWGTPVEVERRRRVRLCLAAYAYEVANAPIMTDVQFDTLAYASEPYIRTGHLDDWWITNFTPDTGIWILSHPDLTQLARSYSTLILQRETARDAQGTQVPTSSGMG